MIALNRIQFSLKIVFNQKQIIVAGSRILLLHVNHISYMFFAFFQVVTKYFFLILI